MLKDGFEVFHRIYFIDRASAAGRWQMKAIRSSVESIRKSPNVLSIHFVVPTYYDVGVGSDSDRVVLPWLFVVVVCVLGCLMILL